MAKQILIILLVFLCQAGGCATLQDAAVSGTVTPVITQSFASKEVSPGDVWKIYVVP